MTHGTIIKYTFVTRIVLRKKTA